jgi:hypothetical protein
MLAQQEANQEQEHTSAQAALINKLQTGMRSTIGELQIELTSLVLLLIACTQFV